jgi:hypothetical protein
MERLKQLDDLIKFMDANHFPYQLDAANRTVELPSKGAPLPGNLYVKWYAHMPLVQFVHFLAEGVPDDRVGAIEKAIVRLNNLYEAPGFGFDHQGRRLYYRMSVPVFPDEGISPVAFNAIGRGCVLAAKEFLAAFQAVLDGRPGEEIGTIVRELVTARSAPA